jgi:hypothetical protein
MDGKDVVLVRIEEWSAVYIDGRSVYQNHTPNWRIVMNLLQGEKINRFRSFWVDGWAAEMNRQRARLPGTLDGYPDKVIPS